MIDWKLSALSIGLGAAATLGFVWLVRRPPGAPSRFAPEEVARADALRDLDSEGDDRYEVDLAEPMEEGEEDQDEVRGLQEEEPLFGDEHYDAVDPEEIGTEWLRRATDSPPSRRSGPDLPVEETGDTAEEVLLGTTDQEGNTEFHPAQQRSSESIELPPNEEELAGRLAAESHHGGSRRG